MLPCKPTRLPPNLFLNPSAPRMTCKLLGKLDERALQTGLRDSRGATSFMFGVDLSCGYLTLRRLNHTHLPPTAPLHVLERRHVSPRLSPGAATVFLRQTPRFPASRAVAPAVRAYPASALSTGRGASSALTSVAASSGDCSHRSSRGSELVCRAQRPRSFSSSGSSSREPAYDAYDYPLPQQQLEAWYWSTVAVSGTESGTTSTRYGSGG